MTDTTDNLAALLARLLIVLEARGVFKGPDVTAVITGHGGVLSGDALAIQIASKLRG